MSEYEVREYQQSDRSGFLSLYQTVMGDEKSGDWFDWKYEGNPYVDHVPMIVTLDEGTIVGARPLFALPIRLGGERTVAFQPGDAMVHPDHRRRGLFSRMMERMIERYSGEYPFYFSFPNDLSGPAHIKHGSRVVSKRSSYYRIEDPASIADARSDRSAIRLMSGLATPIVSAYYGIRDLTTAGERGVTVRTESEPPAGELAAIYRTAVPEGIHAARDERFYRWRFENPDWEYETYLADGNAGPVAAIVAGTSVGSDSTTTKLTDVVPLETAPEPVLVTLLDRILRDHSETDLFVAPPQGIPYSVLRKFGFHADTTPPLPYLTSQTTHVVRTLTDRWTPKGVDITNADNWLLTFVEEDTS
ncbi:Acetyltransferase (GNAT) domain-containing protein [Halorubrum aquaticum]|uniref:Acetyltransferase (GNAT) domain-containing protein n=1 Tax=Halorubrum aquaticum TaxID=387340 RepID=A0A1I2ZN48_9EURY|nr:GNAT family N-acetyltransferase [Halorubrum aquaticum]SFH38939.1 Acetyltransferase (GNAT) domain-containing protein [Halorubrum aquaticum]